MKEKPWGGYEDIHREDGVVLKRIYIEPKSRLSLQSHNFRSEFWVVTKGECICENNKTLSRLLPGDHVHIEAYDIHRLINDGLEQCEILELQYGHCSEDDIVRHEDDYNRGINEDDIPF
jgi:mannose-6-phosphate isomerase-like protein (cupin superfamily)